MPKNLKMHLEEEPFVKIASGKKTVEIRLYDEKRREIEVGDTIEFFYGEKSLLTRVVSLSRFKSFFDLFVALPEKSGTGGMSAEDAAKSMYRYYTAEQETKYGVLGIEIEVLDR